MERMETTHDSRHICSDHVVKVIYFVKSPLCNWVDLFAK